MFRCIRHLFVLATACLVAWSADARAAEKGLVAVLPIDAQEASITRATQQAFEEAVRTAAGDELTPRGYTVLTGETTLALLADNGVDPSKACEATCALEAARQIKARLFISGTLSMTEGEYVAFIRLYENESGRQLASVQVEGPQVKDLRRSFAEKAAAFFAKGLGAAQPVASRSEVAPVPAAPVARNQAEAPRPPEPPKTGRFYVQVDEDEFNGSKVSIVAGRNTHACAKPLSFGLACALEGIPLGPVELVLELPNRQKVTRKLDLTSGDAALGVYSKNFWAIPAIGLGFTALGALLYATFPAESTPRNVGSAFAVIGGVLTLGGTICWATEEPEVYSLDDAPRQPTAK